LNAEKQSLSDENLVERCQRGDPDAMERLILKYQDRIFNVILKICRNYDDAAELTQDTFVKIIENIDKFKKQSGFYTWAFRIAVNLTINRCKRNLKLGISSLDAQMTQTSTETKMLLKDFLADDTEPEPSQIAQNKELCLILTNALMKLDENHRAVIVLRDIEAMSYVQISQVLGIEIGTVKSRICRARKHLREILEALLP